MLRAFKDLIDNLSAPAAAGPPEHFLQLATAVLLVEVMRADPGLGAGERAAILDALRRTFDLPADELETLVRRAEETASGATDFFQFTSAINDGFDQARKVRIVEYMWQVAYADGHLDVHESHVIWKVADLLHVTHGEYIAAKLRAKEARG